MKRAVSKSDWKSMLSFFAKENRGRITRLGIFEGADDFWIESGLPLTAIVVDDRCELPSVELVLGDYAHIVSDAMDVRIMLSHSGDEDGLNITDSKGATTILRFE